MVGWLSGCDFWALATNRIFKKNTYPKTKKSTAKMSDTSGAKGSNNNVHFSFKVSGCGVVVCWRSFMSRKGVGLCCLPTVPTFFFFRLCWSATRAPERPRWSPVKHLKLMSPLSRRQSDPVHSSLVSTVFLFFFFLFVQTDGLNITSHTEPPHPRWSD